MGFTNKRIYRVSEKDDKNLLIRLSAENYDFIKEKAESENKSLSLYVNLLIEDEIRKEANNS